MRGTRRRIAEAAEAAGLGAVVRVHREHDQSALMVLAWVLVPIATIVAGIATVILLSDKNLAWQRPLFAWCAYVTSVFLAMHLAGGRRIGVAEGGIVELTRSGVETATWAETEKADAAQMCGHGDLVAAIRRRRPVGNWTRRRITRLAIYAVLVAAAGWFTAVPPALDVVAGDRPTDLAQFARMCHGGPPFGRAAGYAGPGPHPAIVVLDGDSPDYRSGPLLAPADVQLVGCARSIGDSAAEPRVCAYTRGYSDDVSLDMYQGRYRVDLLAAATGRQVASLTFDGAPAGPCPDRLTVPDDKKHDVVIHTDPGETDYAAALRPVVDGPAR